MVARVEVARAFVAVVEAMAVGMAEAEAEAMLVAAG